MRKLPALTELRNRDQTRLRFRHGGRTFDVYCGPPGRAETLSNAIDRLCEWRDAGFRWPPPEGVRRAIPEDDWTGPTLAEVFADYLEHLEERSGPASYAATVARTTARLLLASRLRASTPASVFGPLDLEAWLREVAATPRPDGKRYQASTVNRYRRAVFRAYEHAAKRRQIPPSALELIRTAASVRPSEAADPTGPVEAVDDLAVAWAIGRMPPVLADTALFVRLTGCRPGEARTMRADEIRRGDRVWRFAPGRHKTEHLGREHAIEIGPAAQRVLRPYLDLDPEGVVFKSPATGQAYGRTALRQAIRRALRSWSPAFPPWHPHQLRHAMLTEVRARYGLEHGKAVAGHGRIETTQVYAERDRSLAQEVAARLG